VVRIVAVINVTVEAVRPMKPGPGADENSASEPIRTVVPIGGAVIGRVIEVPVWAYWRRPNLNDYLSRCFHGDAEKDAYGETEQANRFE
jgi:hypothetical protein